MISDGPQVIQADEQETIPLVSKIVSCVTRSWEWPWFIVGKPKSKDFQYKIMIGVNREQSMDLLNGLLREASSPLGVFVAIPD